MTLRCISCNKEFPTYPSRIRSGRGKYCSRDCASSTLFVKGHVPWHKGKKKPYSQQQLANITLANKKNGLKLRAFNSPHWRGGKQRCIDCGKELGHYLKDTRCRRCCSLFYSGRNAWAWKGGLVSKDKILRTRFLVDIKPLILKRDNYTCQVCDQYGGNLHVDHIKSWADYPELRFEINNCRTLCMACHYYVTFKRKMPNGLVWGNNLGRRVSS